MFWGTGLGLQAWKSHQQNLTLQRHVAAVAQAPVLASAESEHRLLCL